MTLLDAPPRWPQPGYLDSAYTPNPAPKGLISPGDNILDEPYSPLRPAPAPVGTCAICADALYPSAVTTNGLAHDCASDHDGYSA